MFIYCDLTEKKKEKEEVEHNNKEEKETNWEIEEKLNKFIKRFADEFKIIVEEVRGTIRKLKSYEESHEFLLKKIETSFQKVQKIVKLDIGGKVFKVSKEVLMSIENTYFFALLSNSHRFKTQEDGSFFIDRNIFLRKLF